MGTHNKASALIMQ